MASQTSKCLIPKSFREVKAVIGAADSDACFGPFNLAQEVGKLTARQAEFEGLLRRQEAGTSPGAVIAGFDRISLEHQECIGRGTTPEDESGTFIHNTATECMHISAGVGRLRCGRRMPKAYQAVHMKKPRKPEWTVSPRFPPPFSFWGSRFLFFGGWCCGSSSAC